MRILCIALLAIMFGATPFSAIAAPTITATGGDIVVTLLGGDASYTDQLTFNGQTLGSNRSAVGTTVDLGSFAAGTVLTFGLTTSAGDTFLSSSPNALGMAGNVVAFEDLPGLGDSDFNDMLFAISGTTFGSLPTTPAPEPSAWAMMLTGFGAIGLFMRKRIGAFV